MYSTIYKSGKAAVFLLLALVLASCGGGGSGDGGFTNPGDVLDLEWSTADGTNQVDWFFVSSEPELQDCGAADFGLNPVKELTLQVFDQEGQFFAAEEIAVSLSRTTGNGGGSMCVPIPEGVTPEEGVNDCGGNGLFGPFSRFIFENSNGIEKVFFFAGANANGTVELEATTEDPASGQQVSERFTMNIVPTEPTFPIATPITSMSFTGPFVNAVLAGQNTLGLQEGENILQDGTYLRLLSVIASDENGNPPSGCANNNVDFFLIDGPLTGYPAQGPGGFAVAGADGNPEEGGVTFTVPSVPGGGFVGPVVNSPIVRPLNDRLVLDGRQQQNPGGSPAPNNRIFSGIWRIEQVLNDNGLTIEQRVDPENGRSTPPFPQNPAQADTGSTVPYIIGSALNGNVFSTGVFNETGVANTVLTYPVWRLGQTAVLAACTHFQQDLNEDGAITDPRIDRRICSVLNTCDANGANCNSVYLPVTTGTDISLTVAPTELGANTVTPISLCLRDRNFAPIPAALIDYDISGALGSASVTINDNDALSGILQTEGDGCVTAIVASSGQAPGTEPIPITFTAGGVAEPVVLNINGPGTGKLSATISCGGEFCIQKQQVSANGCQLEPVPPGPISCTVDLLLTDDRGGVIPDIPITHTSDQILLGITYNPALGNFGITDENGENGVSVTANTDALPTITFEAGTATVDASLVLPDCAPPTLPDPLPDICNTETEQ